MATVLPRQALLPRFTVSRHPRHLLIIRTIRGRSGTRTTRRAFRFRTRVVVARKREGGVHEKAYDIARGGGRVCADARRFYPQFQRRLGLGLALLSLLRRLHVPLLIRLLSVLALSASLGRLRLVSAIVQGGPGGPGGPG
jgi:hypothetical protein